MHQNSLVTFFEHLESKASKNTQGYTRIIAGTVYQVGSIIFENKSKDSIPQVSIKKTEENPDLKIEKKELDNCLNCFKQPQVIIKATINSQDDIIKIEKMLELLKDSTKNPDIVFELKNNSTDPAVSTAIKDLYSSTGKCNAHSAPPPSPSQHSIEARSVSSLLRREDRDHSHSSLK